MQQDDNQKNLLLAVALSAMVLLGWQLLFVNPKIKDEQQRKVSQQQSQQVPGETAAPSATPGALPNPRATPGSLPSATASPVTTSREGALALSPRVQIASPGII